MPTLEQRVNELENQVRLLIDHDQRKCAPNGEPWWKRHSRAFENSPLYDEAMQLGSEYRRSQPNAADSPDEFTE